MIPFGVIFSILWLAPVKGRDKKSYTTRSCHTGLFGYTHHCLQSSTRVENRPHCRVPNWDPKIDTPQGTHGTLPFYFSSAVPYMPHLCPTLRFALSIHCEPTRDGKQQQLTEAYSHHDDGVAFYVELHSVIYHRLQGCRPCLLKPWS